MSVKRHLGISFHTVILTVDQPIVFLGTQTIFPGPEDHVPNKYKITLFIPAVSFIFTIVF